MNSSEQWLNTICPVTPPYLIWITQVSLDKVQIFFSPRTPMVLFMRQQRRDTGQQKRGHFCSSDWLHMPTSREQNQAEAFQVQWDVLCEGVPVSCAWMCVPAGIRDILVYFGALACDSSVLWCGWGLPSGLAVTRANTSAHRDTHSDKRARIKTQPRTNSDTCCAYLRRMPKGLSATSTICWKLLVYCTALSIIHCDVRKPRKTTPTQQLYQLSIWRGNNESRTEIPWVFIQEMIQSSD